MLLNRFFRLKHTNKIIIYHTLQGTMNATYLPKLNTHEFTVHKRFLVLRKYIFINYCRFTILLLYYILIDEETIFSCLEEDSGDIEQLIVFLSVVSNHKGGIPAMSTVSCVSHSSLKVLR